MTSVWCWVDSGVGEQTTQGQCGFALIALVQAVRVMRHTRRLIIRLYAGPSLSRASC